MLHFSISRAILALNHAMLIYYLVRLREVTVDHVALCNNGFWAVGALCPEIENKLSRATSFQRLKPLCYQHSLDRTLPQPDGISLAPT